MTALTAYFNLLSLTRPVAWRTIWASAVNSRLGRMRLARFSPPDAKSDESSETQVFVGFCLAGNLAKYHIVTAQRRENQRRTPLRLGQVRERKIQDYLPRLLQICPG